MALKVVQGKFAQADQANKQAIRSRIGSAIQDAMLKLGPIRNSKQMMDALDDNEVRQFVQGMQMLVELKMRLQ